MILISGGFPMRRLFACLSLSACLAPTVLLAQKPSVRDVFWSASDLVAVAPNPGARKPARTAAPPRKTAAASAATPHIAPQQIAQNGYGEQPHLVRASLQTQQIGLRYSLLLRGADGSYREVSPDAVFHAGDHLRLSLMSNEPGFLYVITQGSSGSWSPIFPGKETGPEANRIQAGQVYQVPGTESAFQFDTTAGTEKLFVVLSRERITDLDGAVERLKTPTSAPAPPQAGVVLEASNRIPDDLVQRLASRDLTLVSEEKVDQKATASTSGEKAVYVVAKQDAASPTHEVVARITLNHQ